MKRSELTKNQRTVLLPISGISVKKIYSVAENEQLTLVLLAKESMDYQIEVELNGQGAQADIYGIIIGNKSHEMKLQTLQNHKARDTRSDLLIKGALKDKSLLKYEGYIRIEKEAQKSNAYQRNDNLLLSNMAKAESKPALEILANDVRCTHGATLGKLDREQLFYLESRGIEKKKAENMLIFGFFQVVIDKINDEKIKNILYKNLKEFVV